MLRPQYLYKTHKNGNYQDYKAKIVMILGEGVDISHLYFCDNCSSHNICLESITTQALDQNNPV